MPFVDEHHLIDLHQRLDRLETEEKQLIEELRKTKRDRNTVRRQNKQWMAVTVIFGLLLAAFVLKEFGKEEMTIDSWLLEHPGRMVIDKQEWSRLKSKEDEVLTLQKLLSVKDSLYKEEDVVYAVQIAALEEKDLALYSKNLLNLNLEKAGPYTRYALGRFLNLDEARKFRKVLIEMGFSDAFIASYTGGKRLRIEEAM